MVNVLTTIAKVAALAALPIMALVASRVPPVYVPIVPPELARPAAAFGVAMIAVLWTYEAWYCVTYASRRDQGSAAEHPARAARRHPDPDGDLRPGQRRLPLRADDRRDEGNGTDRGTRRDGARGPAGATFIALTVVVSTFGNNAAALLAGSRLLFAMAPDGVFLPAAAACTRAIARRTSRSWR